MLFLALYRVFKNMEQLFFDSPAETDVVRRSPTTTKVLYPPRPGIEHKTSRSISSHSVTGASNIYSLSGLGREVERIYTLSDA